MNRTVGWVAALTILVAGTASADMYRWVDQDGNVHYSDKPTQGAAPVTVTPAGSSPSKAPGEGQVAKPSDAEAAAQVRAQQCELARKRLADYEGKDTLYQVDEFGEKRDIAGEDRVNLILKSRQNVEAYCNAEAASTEPGATPGQPPAEALQPATQAGRGY